MNDFMAGCQSVHGRDSTWIATCFGDDVQSMCRGEQTRKRPSCASAGALKVNLGKLDACGEEQRWTEGNSGRDEGNYGHLVVDECHHLSAVSFELVARRSKARYVLGLSATVTRKDGRHPIIVMQCGPVRHRVDARSEAAKPPFDHVVRVRDTSF